MSRLLLLVAFCAGSIITANTSDAHNAHSMQSRDANARYYHYVEYSQQLQMLDDLIRLRKAEIDSLKRRLLEWEPLDRFQTGRALMVTIENTRLVLLQAKLDLKRLEQQRFNLARYRGRYRGW